MTENRDSATLRKVYGILRDKSLTPTAARREAIVAIIEDWADAYPAPEAGGQEDGEAS